MSQIHIQNSPIHRDEGIICKRKHVRGQITLDEAKKLIRSDRLRMTTKTRAQHNCGYREGSSCYDAPDGNNDQGRVDRTSPVNCPRHSRTVTALCKDCLRRARIQV